MNPSFNAYRLAELARNKWYGRRKLAELKHDILVDIQCHDPPRMPRGQDPLSRMVLDTIQGL